MNTQKSNTLTHEEVKVLLTMIDSRREHNWTYFNLLRNPSKQNIRDYAVKQGQLAQIGLKLMGAWDDKNSTKRV